jgi:hypothetical protein
VSTIDFRGHYVGAIKGKKEADATWGHLHFYSKEELSMVCKHIRFSEINFVEYGKSAHNALNNLDTMQDEIG